MVSVFFKVWLEEPLSNFEKPLIFFLLFLSILSFVYTIVVAIAVPAQKILGGAMKFCPNFVTFAQIMILEYISDMTKKLSEFLRQKPILS